MQTDKRWIRLNARSHNGHFSYEISNSKCNDIIFEKKKIRTDKQDAELHGLGLKNIKEIVEKYNGHIDISYSDVDFTITILC